MVALVIDLNVAGTVTQGIEIVGRFPEAIIRERKPMREAEYTPWPRE